MKDKILMLIPTLHLTGGAQDQLELLTFHLKKHGIPIKISSIYSKKDIEIKNNFFLNAFLKIKIFLKIRKFSKVHRIIHLHGLGESLYFVAFLSLFFQNKIIVKVPRSGTGSYINMLKTSFLRRFLFLMSQKRITFFIALTKDCIKELMDIGVHENKIKKIPNGVEVPHKYTKEFNEVIKIAFAGRLIKRKKVHHILNSLKPILNSKYLKFQLYIIGDGPEKEKLIVLSKALNLDKLTVFTGEIDNSDVLDIFKKSDVFILPSESEGMSNALLQACANGCIPIVKNISQNRDVITDENGFLFDNIYEISDFLKRLDDEVLRKRISTAAFQNMKENFDIKKISLDYKILYEEINN